MEFGRTKIFFNANAGQVDAVNQKGTNREKYRLYIWLFRFSNKIKLCRRANKREIIVKAQMLEGANNRRANNSTVNCLKFNFIIDLKCRHGDIAIRKT